MKNKFKLLSALIMALLVTTSGPQPLMSITISANELPLSTTVMESTEAESPESIANSAITQEMPILESTTTPTTVPIAEPTATLQPTPTPTSIPSTKATVTSEPTITPTAVPTAEPTTMPTPKTSVQATAEPTVTPTPTVSSVAGDTFTQDDWEYEVLSETEVSISKYNGENTTVDIPNEVLNDGQEYTVIKIGENAFSNCVNITNVNFPESLKTIGDYAFSGCKSLTSVELPKSLKSLGPSVFYNCTNLSSVQINSNLQDPTETNYDSPFQKSNSEENKNISVTFGEDVTRVPAYLFEDSSYIAEVNFSENITEIGDYVFSGCSSLTSVNLPKSLKAIGSGAFSNSGLSEIYVNGNLEDGQYYIESPSGVSMSLERPFGGTTKNIHLIFNEGVTRIPSEVFASNKSIVSITLPNSIRTISSHAFSGCEALATVNFWMI